MDRLNQLRRDPNISSNSSIDSSLESHEGSGFETANESSGSKYFSFIEDDPSLHDSNLKDVSLVEGEINDNISGSSQQLLDSASAASMLSQLSPVNKSKDSIDNFKIDSHIDAANILSGGVNIFDDNDNSGDENDLVIDDNALLLDTEEDCKSFGENINPTLLHAENAVLIKDDKQKLKDDKVGPQDKPATENDSVTTSENFGAENPTYKIATEAEAEHCHSDKKIKDDRCKDLNVTLTYSVKSSIVKPDADNTLNLGNVKTQDINHDDIKTAMLQNDDDAIQPNVQNNITRVEINIDNGRESATVSNSKDLCDASVFESTSQNVVSGYIVEPKEQHFKPSIVAVATQQENTNAVNVGKPHIDLCSAINAENVIFAPTVQQNSVTDNNMSSTSTQNADSIKFVLPSAPKHSNVEDIIALIAEDNTNASNIVTYNVPENAFNDVACTTESSQIDNENIQIALAQPEPYLHSNILISAGAQNIDTDNVVLSTQLKFVDTGDNTTTSIQQNVDARHNLVSTSQKESDLIDVPMPYKKNETPNASNIATSISSQYADSKNADVPITPEKSDMHNIILPTAQINAVDSNIVPLILPQNIDAVSLVPNVQNNAKIDSSVEPMRQNNVETLSPVVQQKNSTNNCGESSPLIKIVEPTVQQNDNSVKDENDVEAVVGNPANCEVGGVEDPPNVLLQIDGRDVVAVDVGNNLYLYRKETDDEVTAIQIVPVENEELQCKFLNVRHNEEGNFEVYEEHIMDCPTDADKNNEVESTTKLESHGIFKSDDVKKLEAKPSHLPTKDLNKVINIQEVSDLGKVVVHNVSTSPVQPDKLVTKQGPMNNNSVSKISEDKIHGVEFLKHQKHLGETNKISDEALPGSSGISKESFRNAVDPMCSSTPKAKTTKEIAKSNVAITATNSIVKPISNLTKIIETSTSSESPLAKPPTATLPILSTIISGKDQTIMEPSLDVKNKLQNPNVKQDGKLEILQDPRTNNFDSAGLKLNSVSKPNLTEFEKKQDCKVKPCELLDQNKVLNIKLVEPHSYNVKHNTVPILQNTNLKSSNFVDKSQHLNSKSSKPVEKLKTYNFKPDAQLDKLPNFILPPSVLGEQHHSRLKSCELLEKPHTTNIKPHTKDNLLTYNLKPLIPLDKQRQSIKSFGSLDNPNIKPYVPLAKPRKGNLKTLRPVDKLQNANLKSNTSVDKSFYPNLKSGKPQTSQKPHAILGKQTNPKVKHVGEPGKPQSTNVSTATVEKQQNYNVKSHLPLQIAKTARLSMQYVPQLKKQTTQVGHCATKNSHLKHTGHRDQTHPVINMSTTSANIPGPLRFVIEPPKKKEITVLTNRERETQASSATQPSGVAKNMDLDNNVYNDTYISEALNVRIQPDTAKETQKFVWSKNPMKDISKKGDETKKSNLPKKSTDNILMDTVSVSVSVLPAQPRTNHDHFVNKQNYTVHMKGEETVQKKGCDTTVTAVPVLPINAHLINKNCDGKNETDTVIVNLSESSIDSYSEEEILECQPVTGDVDWEAREKALTDKRDSEYIESALHKIEESISKMDEDKPQPSSDTANTILLNTALHNPPMDISILPNILSSPNNQLIKGHVKEIKSVITEVDFDKFVRRNSHHAAEDKITLQLSVHDKIAHQAKSLPGPSETKSNINPDKGSITGSHNLNANKSNITLNTNSHIPTKVYANKTVPAPKATSKYERVTSEKYISSETYRKTSGKTNEDSINPRSYLEGVQKVNESFKFKRAYQSALESLQTKDSVKTTTSNLRIKDKPVTVVILDPVPTAIVPDKAITGLTSIARSNSHIVPVNSSNMNLNLVANSTSPLVAFNNANVGVNSMACSMSSVVAVKNSVLGKKFTFHTASPILAAKCATVGPDLMAPCTISVVAANNASSLNYPNATVSPTSSESVHNSSTEEKSIHAMQKSKHKRPRKQVLSSVERLDMEIVFPNLSEVVSRSNELVLPAKARKRKVEVASHTEVPKKNAEPVLLKKKVIAKESLASDLTANCYSENSIGNDDKTISDQVVTQDKDLAKDKEVTKVLSKCTSRGNKNKHEAEENRPTKGTNEKEQTEDATKQRDMPQSMKVGKEVNEIYEMKKGRGRPRKSIVPILIGEPSTSSDTPAEIKSLFNVHDFEPPTPRTRHLSLHSNQDYSSDDDQVIVNWSMGKINEKIVCPICSKLFRSENVVFKHVKHCTGPDKVISPERKIPSYSGSFAEEEHTGTHNPSKRPRGRPSNKQIANGTGTVETVSFGESSNSHKDGHTELNDTSGEILDSPKCTNSTNTNTHKTVNKFNVKSHDVPITNEKSEMSSENSSLKYKNVKGIDKVSSKFDTLTPLTRLAKVMKVPVQTNPCYSCETCGKSFRQLSYLSNHRRAHHQVQIRSHIKHRVLAPSTTHETSALNCEVCKKGFRKLHHLVQHREIHKCFAMPPSREETKKKMTESKTVLPTVVTKQEVSKPAPLTGFRCEACDKSFRKLYHLVEHRETHDTHARLSAPSASPLISTSVNPPHATILIPDSAPLVPHIVPSDLEPVAYQPLPVALAEPLVPQLETTVPNTVHRPASPDRVTTPTVPSCEICGKSFRKLHYLIEHRESHMVSKDITEPKIETPNSDVKSTLLAKDIIHECPHCYMVFPNEPSLNRHSNLCQRKKRSRGSSHSSDPTINATSDESQCDNNLLEVVIDAPSKIIPVNCLLETSPVQLETNDKDKCGQCETKNKNTSIDTEMQASILAAPLITQSKEEITESDDSEIVFNTSKSVDCEIRYMINPLFENVRKRIPTKRASLQSDISTDRINQLSRNVSRRTSVPTKLTDLKSNQHSPPKKSKKMPIQLHNELTTSKTNIKLVKEPVTNRKAQSNKDDDDVLYSFPNRRTSRASTSTTSGETILNTKKIIIPNVKKSLRSSNQTLSLKTNTQKSSEKRKSLVGIAKRKNAMLQETVSKTNLRRCRHNLTDRAGMTEYKSVNRKRPAPLRHLCDCGELFSSATLLAQHTSLAHTPPRIRRPRDAPPPPHPQHRPVAAHHGVPIPPNMRKAVSGIKF